MSKVDIQKYNLRNPRNLRMIRLSGFTLLELLIALAVFSVLATMAYSGLNTVLEANAQTARQAELLAALQMTFTRLGRDLEQQINRPVRDEFGEVQAALQGISTQMEFTRAGWRNPLGQKRSSLQRVAYYREENTFYRAHWPVLDRVRDSKPAITPLLKEIDEFSLRYLDETLQWHTEWPPLASQKPLRPKAVEVSLSINGWGHLTRLFGLPFDIPPQPKPVPSETAQL
ncbi:MAG: type II secretion system minor pseudopilin GspJ [Gammaproteobacteria bacterium]|nr:type II secretion system minor pseudopilin GspJ [Gammaproteobacteria bacterium]